MDLLGASDIEAGQVMSVLASLDELNASMRKIMPYGVEPTEEQLNQFFSN